MEATRKSQFGNGFRLTTYILARPNKSLVVRVKWQKNKNKNIVDFKLNYEFLSVFKMFKRII